MTLFQTPTMATVGYAALSGCVAGMMGSKDGNNLRNGLMSGCFLVVVGAVSILAKSILSTVSAPVVATVTFSVGFIHGYTDRSYSISESLLSGIAHGIFATGAVFMGVSLTNFVINVLAAPARFIANIQMPRPDGYAITPNGQLMPIFVNH